MAMRFPLMKSLLLLVAMLLLSTPAFAQSYGGGFNVQGYAGYQANSTGKGVGRRGGLPPTATSSVGLNIVEDGSYGGNWKSFGGWNGGGSDGSFPGSGSDGGLPPGFPPSPGPGFQLMTQHGE